MVGQMGFVDYYIILGVTPEADTDTIRRAYIRYARLFHPDINKSAEADEMMRWINQAKEILLDNPQRREAYDRDREYFYRMMNRRAELEQQKETCADSPRLPSHSERINPPSYVISPDIFRHEPASKDTRRELQAKADAIRDKINQIQTERTYQDHRIAVEIHYQFDKYRLDRRSFIYACKAGRHAFRFPHIWQEPICTFSRSRCGN